MFYNGSKIRSRSTELVGALFKGPRLKLAIGGAILLAVAVTATMAGIFTNISEAQAQDETVYIGFGESTLTVQEGENTFSSGTRTISRLSILLTVEGVGGVASQIPTGGGSAKVEIVSIDGGTAKKGEHFTFFQFTNSERTFEPGIRESTVPLLEIVDDNILDGPRAKNFFLELKFEDGTSIPSGVAIDPNRNRLEVIIEDDDETNYIGFEQTEYTVTEGTDLKEVFNVRASRGALYGTATAIIRFNTFDDSAISGADFDGVSNHRITFNNSNGSQDVDVNILNDSVIEARSESFIAVLSPSGDLPAGVEFDPNGMTATVTIMDDDKGELRFTRSSFEATVNEMGAGDSTATVSVGVFETFDTTYENFTFVISTMDGSGDNGAVAGTDYTAITNMEIEYEFRLGSGRPVDVPITILATDNNFVLDEDKTFSVILKLKSDETLPPELFELFPAEGVRAEVVIKDNDAVIGFEETLITVREGEDANTRVTVVVLEGGLADGVEAELVLSSLDAFSDPSITAREGSHFEGLGDNRVSLSKTAPSTQSPLITIRDDSTFDAPRVKYFFVDATSTFGGDLLPQGVTLDPDRSRVEVRIVDNDNPARIGFENSTYEVIENREMVTLTVKNLGGELISGAVATVSLTTRDGTALAGTNGDYTATTREIQLSSQMSEAEVTIPIVDNEDEEPDKRFFVDLDVVEPLPFAVELATDMTTAEVTILDGDATIGFVLQSYLVLENGGQREVDIEVKSGSLAEQISVGIRTVPGDAQPGPIDEGGDYIYTDEDLELSRTQCDCTAVIPINLDRLAEGTERFYAVLDGADLPKGVKLATGFERAEVAISDEIILTIGFEDAPYSVSEGAGGVTISIGILSEGVTLGKEVKVDYEITINDVLASEDFQVTTGTVTFEVSDNEHTRRDVWIPVIDDYLLEGDETFEVKLSTLTIGPDEPAVQLNPGTANLTVTDNDAMSIPVGFLAPEYDVGEASGTVELTFGLLGGFTLPEGVTVAINYATSNDSATKDEDYREALGSGSVVLSADEPQRTIVVPIIDDSISVEGEESFLVTLTSDDGRVDLLTGLPQATVNIEDDDKLTIGFGSPRYGVFESDGRVVFEIRIIDGELPDGTDITINYRIEPGSATAGDYGSSGAGVILTAADTSELSQITIVDDNVPEAHESFRLVLTGDSTVFEFAPGETLVEILNDDIATIRFDQPSYTASEAGANPNIGIISDVALPTGFTLTVSTEAGSAMAGEDYTALDNKEAFLPDGYTTGYIENVSVNNDLLIEFDETFEVVLSAPYGLPPGVELDPLQSRVPVKIESEDTAVAGISETAAIDEDENATFNFRISHPQNLPVGQDVRVYYGVDEADTSATEGEDYTLPEMNYVTFSRSNATAQVTIPIINDKISEDDETLGLILLSSDHPDIEYMGAGRTITIRDDDPVTVGIIGEIARTVNEGDGSVAIEFGVTAGTLADDPSAAISVTYATSADTALEADDYTPVAGAVILTALNSRATIRIPIIDDAVLEGDEEFEFTVTPGVGEIAGDTSAEITITDDDQGTIGFAGDPDRLEEVWENDGSGLIRLNVETSPSLSVTFALRYVIEPGTTASTAASTATSEDYMDTVLEGVLNLGPNKNFHRLSIRLNDDSIAEGAESLVIRLVVPEGTTLPPGFSLTNATQEVIILDNDSTLVGFGTDSAETEIESFTHDLGGFNLGVGLGALSSQEGFLDHTITLNYVIEPGTATSEDYGQVFSTRRTPTVVVTPGTGPTNGTITLFPTDPDRNARINSLIRPGDYNIVIPFVNDNLVENDETFTVRLSVPEGTPLPPNTFLYKDSVEVTIQNDDDVEINFNDTSPLPVHEEVGKR